MSDVSVSIVFEQVRLLSDRFTRGWERGKSPAIEDYLRRLPEKSRPTLLRNLLLAEVDFPRRSGEGPKLDDYLRRFPDHAATVRQVFSASLTVDTFARFGRIDPSVDLRSDAAGVTMDLPQPARQLRDYLLINELGRGPFGSVWEAEHVEQRFRVALKMLPLEQ